ncbi:MAG TPA: ketopantoate reductase C-terminal domain-containing protein, partial [Candidatus Binatia bacterium]|nr:ketopantoate reductase C-terminal domain-containing protein [Candidatus Binatia bacterium]
VPEDEMRQRVQTEVKLASIAGHSRAGGSTWQSLTRGLPAIEVDFLNGEIVLLGKLHGVPTPYNYLLQKVANQMVRTGKRPGSVTVEDLQRMVAESGATHN